MFQVLGLLLQIKFAMTQSHKWARDRPKLPDPRFYHARDISGSGYILRPVFGVYFAEDIK
jgi:hypothetical protein